ncbi:MAG: lipoprotein signal peptidase [Gammaproteobacteria bacterium]|nr:lipoprotein signal peptidase [Gammaproteobacteria bacterium]
MRRVAFRFLWISAAIIVFDQLSKWVALKYLLRHAEVAVAPFLNLTLVFNRGAAFGFLNSAEGWQNVFFVVIALVATAIIFYLLNRLSAAERSVAIGLSLILGGALGNLIDRFIHGHVIDFIDIYYKTWHWPAFNVADSAITIGAALLILDAFGIGTRKRHAES